MRNRPVITAPPKAEAAPDRVVTLAVVTGAHGIGGEVRLKVFADDLSSHRSFNDGALTATSLRAGGGGAIARFAQVADRTAAEGLRGTLLTVPRSALPPLEPGEYYHCDLIGLACVTEEGVSIGMVVTVENFGAGDVIEIEKPDGKRFMVPIRAAQIEAERAIVEAAFVE